MLKLDIGKAIDAASGFAQGLEKQDLEDKLVRKETLLEDGEEVDGTDDDNDDES